jgi:hypothetical protein
VTWGQWVVVFTVNFNSLFFFLVFFLVFFVIPQDLRVRETNSISRIVLISTLNHSLLIAGNDYTRS